MLITYDAVVEEEAAAGGGGGPPPEVDYTRFAARMRHHLRWGMAYVLALLWRGL
jgi:hypothetical protein